MRTISNKDFEEQNIYVSEHACQRWSQRVNRKQRCREIKQYIRECAKKGKLEHEWNNYYILEDDIVIAAKQLNSGRILIITTFGRRSDSPCLNNLPEFVRMKNKYGKMLSSSKKFI